MGLGSSNGLLAGASILGSMWIAWRFGFYTMLGLDPSNQLVDTTQVDVPIILAALSQALASLLFGLVFTIVNSIYQPHDRFMGTGKKAALRKALTLKFTGYSHTVIRVATSRPRLIPQGSIMRILVAIFTIAVCVSPTLAFGQTIDECRDRQKLTEMAIEVRDRVGNGESEDSLLIWADNIETQGLQAAAYKAIEAYTFRPASKSVPMVVTVMGYLCSKTYRP